MFKLVQKIVQEKNAKNGAKKVHKKVLPLLKVLKMVPKKKCFTKKKSI